MIAAIALTATMALALPASGLAQLRDVGAFGETCPAPPLPPAPAGARLELPGAPTSAPLPETPWLPLAHTVSRRVLPHRGGWPVNAPHVLAILGEDPGSLTVARDLPNGTAVYVLPPARPETLARVRGACPRCVVGPGGGVAVTALGVRAYPAVIRWTGTVVEIVEGAP